MTLVLGSSFSTSPSQNATEGRFSFKVLNKEIFVESIGRKESLHIVISEHLDRL